MSLSRILPVKTLRTSDLPAGIPPSVSQGRFFLFSAFFAFFLLSGPPLCAQQQPSMPGMQMPHEHSQAPPQSRTLEFPGLGRAQSNAKEPFFTLDQALATARQNNPTLRQAEAGIRAARARAQQAALYPNPTVGYAGDEIRGGESRSGKQGFFLEQSIVTGGKLARARNVFTKEAQLAEIEAEEQKVRVESAVRIAFYRVLTAQELVDARADLARIAGEILDTQQKLQNTGQADETEVLEAELEARRMKLSARAMENTLREEWRALASVLGQPDLPLQTISGDLEHGWPNFDERQVETVAAQSPANRIASTATDRARAELARAQREKTPDILARAGLDYNREPLDNPLLSTGWQWNAQLAVELPLFNRNQGNVAAARAEIDRAESEKQRVALTLRERASSVFDEYANARLIAEEYRDNILPLAKKCYGLMFDRYGEMLASYPRVLETKRKLFELHSEYIASLETVWSTGLALQGFLLTDGLEAPTQPGEMDRTIRETNLPTPERGRLP
jgi:cobalt-zinc-cadmium efflux system outer membrane protein